MTARHLVLIGMMGAGKSSVGAECARRLGRPLVDTDDVVAALAGVPVPEIFATAGEAAFRTLERQAVADVCRSPEPLVVACGGGVPVDAGNRRALRAAGVVVWLRAPVALLAARVGDGDGRPLLGRDRIATLGRLDAQRHDAYEAAAHVSVDTADLDVESVAGAVLVAFGEHGA